MLTYLLRLNSFKGFNAIGLYFVVDQCQTLCLGYEIMWLFLTNQSLLF